MKKTIEVYFDKTKWREIMTGGTFVIEADRWPSMFGELGEAKGTFRLTRPTSSTSIARADSVDELRKWARRYGAKRVEVI